MACSTISALPSYDGCVVRRFGVRRIVKKTEGRPGTLLGRPDWSFNERISPSQGSREEVARLFASEHPRGR